MPVAPRPFVPASPTEYLLHALASALTSHGLRPKVGLMLPETFGQHAGGIGIIVGLVAPASERAASRETAARLLTQMGCAWVKPCEIGVEGHLAGELLPAPELPPVPVLSADSCSAAELAGVVPWKRCAECGDVKPVTEFAWRDRKKGLLGSYCKQPCERDRVARLYRERKARASRLADGDKPRDLY